MKSYPAKFMSFQLKILQMGASQKLQNSLQIFIILWLAYPIHTKLSILGDSWTATIF